MKRGRMHMVARHNPNFNMCSLNLSRSCISNRKSSMCRHRNQYTSNQSNMCSSRHLSNMCNSHKCNINSKYPTTAVNK